eukprot:12737894-Ditylum_brightwellii.AAC.1
MDLALKAHINQKALWEWEAGTKQANPPKDKQKEGNVKFITLLSKFEETLKSKVIIGRGN